MKQPWRGYASISDDSTMSLHITIENIEKLYIDMDELGSIMSVSSPEETEEMTKVAFKIYVAFQTELEEEIEKQKITERRLVTDYLNKKISPLVPFDTDQYLTSELSGIEENYIKFHPVLYSKTIEKIENLNERITLPAKFNKVSICFHELVFGAWVLPSGRFILEITISAEILSDELMFLPSIVRSIYFEPEETFELSMRDRVFLENCKGIDDIIEMCQYFIILKVEGSTQNYKHPVLSVWTDRSAIDDCKEDLIQSITSSHLDFDIGKPYNLPSGADTLIRISKIGSLIVTNHDILLYYQNLLIISMEELFLVDRMRNNIQEYISHVPSSLKGKDLTELTAIREDLEEFQRQIVAALWRYDSVEVNLSYEFPRILRIFSKEFGIEKRKKEALSFLEFLQDNVLRDIDIRIEDMRRQTEQDIQSRLLSLQWIFILGVTATLISTFFALSQHTILFYPLPLANRLLCLIFYFFLVSIISYALYLLISLHSNRE